MSDSHEIGCGRIAVDLDATIGVVGPRHISNMGEYNSVLKADVGINALVSRVQDEQCFCFHPASDGTGGVVCGRCAALTTWEQGK